MKKFSIALLAVLSIAVLAFSCGTDNSSTVSYQIDEFGCLADISGYDIVNESQYPTGLRSVNYIWECADYYNPAAQIDVTESKVTLIFEGGACLRHTATMVGAGYCTVGKSAIL
jgi:hypothetical protein